MLPVSEADDFGLDGGAIARTVDLFGDVSVEVQVVQDDLRDVVVGEGLVASDLEEQLRHGNFYGDNFILYYTKLHRKQLSLHILEWHVKGHTTEI